MLSPVETRSAKKKKLPPRAPIQRDGLMLFSPPDQELNEQREKEKLDEQEENRYVSIEGNLSFHRRTSDSFAPHTLIGASESSTTV